MQPRRAGKVQVSGTCDSGAFVGGNERLGEGLALPGEALSQCGWQAGGVRDHIGQSCEYSQEDFIPPLKCVERGYNVQWEIDLSPEAQR